MRNIERRRASWRAYQHRKRAKALAEARLARTTCPFRFNQVEECGGRLETIVLPGGQTKVVCERCERLRAGICLECPRPVAGRIGMARRCAHHLHLAGLRHREAWRQRNLKYCQLANKARYRLHRDEQRAAARRWRRAHPDKVREQTARGTARRRAAREAARARQAAA